MSEQAGYLVELMESRRRSIAHMLGRRTLHPVTSEPGYVMPDPYPGGVDDKVLLEFQERTGITLPADVVTWLKISNGAPGFLGIDCERSSNIEDALYSRPHWKKNAWIPLARDAFGNFYLIVPQDKAFPSVACFVEGTSSSHLQYVAASNALHLVQFLLEEERALKRDESYGWPSNEEFVLSKDPDLEKITIAPLPWNS